MLQESRSLDVYYGNCSNIGRASRSLNERANNNFSDIFAFTEVVPSCLNADDRSVTISFTRQQSNAATLCRDSDSFTFRRAAVMEENFLIVKAEWGNHSLMIINVYLSPNPERLPSDQFRAIVSTIFNLYLYFGWFLH